MVTDTVRVGVVGFGRMGLLHAALLRVMPSVQLVGVVDSDIRARTLVESIGVGVPIYTALERFIEDQRPDAVFACVPPFANPHVARLCAAFGVHVFVEKPLANSLANAADMLKVVGRADGLRHGVGFMVRHRQLWRKGKQVLDSGVLGALHLVEGSAYQGSVLKGIKGWLGRKELAGGGAFASIGSHLLDVLTWLCGDVAEVSAQVTYINNMDVEDRGEADLIFQSGVEGHLEVAWDLPHRPNLELRVVMRGANGDLILEDQELHVRLARAHGEWPEGVTTIRASHLPTSDAFFLGGEGYFAQDADFVSAILRRSSPTVTWEDGYRVQAVLDAVYRSAAANGNRVSLNEMS